jgi:hypothetical protein
MHISLAGPDHSTLSRRMKTLEIDIPVQPKDKARHGVIDSIGVKVYGEREWKTRQHGVSKRRSQRKLHLGVVLHLYWRIHQDYSICMNKSLTRC